MTTVELATGIIYVPGAPAIPGLTFRHFRGESDYPLIVAVNNARLAADHVEEVDTLENVANLYTPSHNFDPYQDVFLVEAEGGTAIAAGRVWWRTLDEGSTVYIHVGGVRPEWRRKGIGRALLHLEQRRLREIAVARPVDGLRFFQAFVADTEIGLEAMLNQEGFTPVRYSFEMVRPTLDDIPDAALPDGLEVRPARPEHYRVIWEAKNEAFRDHWGAFQPTEWHYQRWLNSPEFQPSVWKVAWDGDQIAGMVLGFINEKQNAQFNRKRGWTENIAVRRPWRKRGLARALIAASLRELNMRDMTEASLGVDSENLSGALRLYESVGFRAVKRFTTYRKPLA